MQRNKIKPSPSPRTVIIMTQKNRPKRWKMRPLFHPLGGVPSSDVGLGLLDRVYKEDENATAEDENATAEDENETAEEKHDDDDDDDDPENDDGSSEIATGTGRLTQSEPEMSDERERSELETDVDIVQQPIPFQMGITPQPEEVPTGDELTDWYDETPTSEARGSTDVGPAPKAKATMRRERSPRNLRSRQWQDLSNAIMGQGDCEISQSKKTFSVKTSIQKFTRKMAVRHVRRAWHCGPNTGAIAASEL